MGLTIDKTNKAFYIYFYNSKRRVYPLPKKRRLQLRRGVSWKC